MKRFASYIRVSTKEQGDSRLGIEAQRRINNLYIDAQHGQLVQEVVEVYSGRIKNKVANVNLDTLLKKRPLLRDLIKFCQKEKATLVVKDLSRLGRNQLLISYLIQNDIQFVCAESPNDNPMILQIKAAVFEQEGREISNRTKQALESLRNRGHKLGCPLIFNPETKNFLAKINQQKAIDAYEEMQSKISELRTKGLSFEQIAKRLNQNGHKTREGKLFYGTTISRILARKTKLQ